MKFLSALTIFLSAFSVTAARDLIGQDPKTWAPQNVSASVLTCDQCKTLVGLVESSDVCKVLPTELQASCEAILPVIEQQYTPEVICQCLSMCESKKWWAIKHNFHF